MPVVGRLHAALAFEVERLGDDADGEDALLARRAGDDRSCTRAGAAAHAGGDEAHMRVRQVIEDLVDALFRGGAADFRLRAGAEALGDMRAELDEPLGLRHGERLRVGVGDDEFDAAKTCRDHVVDGVAAAAADAEYGDAGLQFGDVGLLEIDRHCWSSSFAFPAASPHGRRCGLSSLETVSQIH